MGPQAESDEEFIVLSTPDCTESASYVLFVSAVVTNYYINGGRGGFGGEGGDKGGDGGTGQGPTIYLGQSQAQEPSVLDGVLRGRQTSRATARRVYKAKLEGRESGHMTVAMYEGDGAEKAWKQHLANYESIRHPNIMQLYGLVSTKAVYAMVFHDESIPYRQFLRRFEHSSILSTYIFGYCPVTKNTEFEEAISYIYGVGPQFLRLDDDDPSIWIRSATGELCVDLAQREPERGFLVSTGHAVGLGIFRSDSQHRTCMRITEPLQILPEVKLNWYNYENAPDEQSPNSWIRYDSHRTNTLRLELRLLFWEHGIVKAWLAQANCIFAELEETAHVEDYVCVYTVEFTLRISDGHDIPEGYLFVCPPQDFCTGSEVHVNLYQWPACPAYWSLDPSGADRLSMEDARNLGFPAIHIQTIMLGYSWDSSVYKGLRQFHEGKGFNPDSREVARKLEYPLFEVLSN
ncbi:hypothetical protein MSAN_01504500 [Mycena sanguinolenta]|uniref:Protein kinase domain-containing protein n=1 Tax=Mycena sanguinolenta TaxID=230812 RepID=A0A8H7CWK0_9AGAR|nr:hypothetical protein MSAN_01504500 [Mycena sanguinolenta]